MPVNEYSEVPNSNATVGGIDIAEGCAPGNINNAIRQVMADIAEGVVHAYPQTLDPTKQAAARANIGADKTVNYTAQTLTAPQQAQARDNIGAADSATAAVNTRTITAGTGLTGGGDLTADRTIAADFATEADALAGVATDKVMSPARTMAAVRSKALGEGQTWRNLKPNRVTGTSYQNSTGRTIVISVHGDLQAHRFETSSDGVSWLSHGDFRQFGSFQVPIPPGDYYRISGSAIIYTWLELRHD